MNFCLFTFLKRHVDQRSDVLLFRQCGCIWKNDFSSGLVVRIPRSRSGGWIPIPRLGWGSDHQAIQSLRRLPRRASVSHAPLTLGSGVEPIKLAFFMKEWLWGVQLNISRISSLCIHTLTPVVSANTDNRSVESTVYSPNLSWTRVGITKRWALINYTVYAVLQTNLIRKQRSHFPSRG